VAAPPRDRKQESKSWTRPSRTGGIPGADATSLLPFVLAMICCPSTPTRSTKALPRHSARLFLACHGLIVIAFTTVAVFVNGRMRSITGTGAEDF
jgi:hypothetical protein